ncbi:hypothetical protein AALO_G00029620 [Alosa alosa]|uniref:Uncharacterized protein n=1 Tax=Alosa alosa TaxID=278164 RepID=A0AAV6HBG2_9TELE|nr:hypothetical protein AALO_G00029620 [Alosa alosa]
MSDRKLKRRSGVIISYFNYFRKYQNSQIIPKYLHKGTYVGTQESPSKYIERGVDPVINNPNMPRWHMYPYVRMAFERGY